MTDETIGELGEFGLIARLVERLGPPRADTVVGAGPDDTAVLRLGPDRLQLATIDTQVAGVHFLPDRATPEDIGWKLGAINLSDIAAMGGRPTHALAALTAPPETPAALALGIADGLAAALERWAADLVGGNVARGEALVLDLALLGEVTDGALLLRGGARAGDRVLVSGTLGAAAAGLAWLTVERAGRRRAGDASDEAGPDGGSETGGTVGRPDAGSGAGPDVSSDAGPDSGSSVDPKVGQGHDRAADIDAAVKAALGRLHRPTPRLDVAPLLGPAGATAAIDLSDGLAADIGHLCERSGVGVRVEAARLPIAPAAVTVARVLGDDALAWAVGGGEDYELLLTVPAADVADLTSRVADETGAVLTAVGTVTASLERTLVMADGTERRLAGGWRHF